VSFCCYLGTAELDRALNLLSKNSSQFAHSCLQLHLLLELQPPTFLATVNQPADLEANLVLCCAVPPLLLLLLLLGQASSAMMALQQ
jgi:hypothetical protein